MDWDRIKTVLDEALQRPTHDQQSFVETACADDESVLREVKSLLDVGERASGFFDAPSIDGLHEAGPSTDSPLLSGDTIGPYTLLKQIGVGGFGVVYLAEQTHPVRRQVALKVIKPGVDTKQVLARFSAERQALAMMDHPNIASVFDAGTTSSGSPYFCMELVDGEPITDFCDRMNLTTKDRLEIFRVVCAAVQHAHGRGVIHRDLKPTNILVGMNDGKPLPKIIDFGVAKATDEPLTDHTMVTESFQLIGTPEYMSPEQADTSSCVDIDTRTDVYALGVVLYELLTGGPPFTARQLREAGFGEMIRLIRETEPQKPSTRLSSMGDELAEVARHRRVQPERLGTLVRGDLDWIVMKSLEKDRSRRYETADAFARDIKRYLADETVEATPPSPLYLTRKFIKRNRGVVSAAVVILLLLVLGVSSTTSAMFWALGERSTARIARDNAVESEGIAREAAFEALMISAGQTMRDRKLEETAALLDRINPADRTHWWAVARAMASTRYEVLSGTGRFTWNSDRSLLMANLTSEIQIRDGETLEVINSRPSGGDHRAYGRLKWTSDPNLFVALGGGAQLFSAPDMKPAGPLIETGGENSRPVGDSFIVRMHLEQDDAFVRVFNLHTGDIISERRFEGASRFLSAGRPVGNRWASFSREGAEKLIVSVPDLEKQVILDQRTQRHEPDQASTQSAVFRYEEQTIECWQIDDSGHLSFAWSQSVSGRIHGVHQAQDLVCVRAGRHIILFSVNDGTPLTMPMDVGGNCSAASIDLDRNKLIAELSNKTESRLFSIADWTFPYAVPVARTSCRTLSLSADASLAAISNWDGYFEGSAGSLRLVDTATGLEIARLLEPGRIVGSVALSGDGDLLAVSSFIPSRRDTSRTVRAWSLRSGRLLWEVSRPHAKDQLRFSQDGQRLHAGFTTFDVLSGLIADESVETDPDDLVTPDIRTVIRFSGPRSQTITVLDRASGGETTSLFSSRPFNGVNSTAVSPDSTRLIAPERAGTVGVFDLVTGERIGTLPDAITDTMATAWSPDGTTIATAGEDAVIRLWDANSLDLIGVLCGHDAYVRAIEFSPDGKSLFTISADGTFRVWNDRTPWEQAAETERRRAIADQIRPTTERIALESVFEDASDAWTAFEALDLQAEEHDIGELLLKGALLTRFATSD